MSDLSQYYEDFAYCAEQCREWIEAMSSEWLDSPLLTVGLTLLEIRGMDIITERPLCFTINVAILGANEYTIHDVREHVHDGMVALLRQVRATITLRHAELGID